VAKIAPVPLLTGRAHRESIAQLADLLVIINGHDANKVYDLRSAATYDMGLATPAAPACTPGAAGNVTGDVRYRVRWVDATTGSMSLPGAETTAAPVDQVVSVGIPSSPPARATHWIVERTTDGGRIFYPVNRNYAAPNGTAKTVTSVADNELDGTIRNRESITENQAPLPVGPSTIFPNAGRLFAVSREMHTVAATLTNGSVNITGGSGFTQALVGRDLAVVGDVSGKTIKIATIASAATGTLESAYTGTTGSKVICVAGRGDIIYWTDPFIAEHWGKQLANGYLSNQLTIGDDGDPVLAGCGLGLEGVLLAKRSRLFLLRYGGDPHPVTGDGTLIALPTRRGACGPSACRYVNGYVYGIDNRGVWRYAPGGAVEEIGGSIRHEWRRANLNWERAPNCHIGYDASRSEVHFFVVEGDDQYAKRSWVWSEDLDAWVGSVAWPAGVTCSVELPDTSGQGRMVVYLESSGSAPAVAWMYGLSYTFGVPSTCTPLTGTVTSGGATNLTSTGAAWNTSMPGVPVKLIRAAGTTETQLIVSNTADALTTTAWVGAVPIAGDTYEIGPIETTIRTGRIDFGDGSRKKRIQALWIWAKYKTECVPFKVRAYIDGNSTPVSDFTTTNEDGVSYTNGKPDMQADPTVRRHRYRFPLQDKPLTDVVLEISSSCAGVPWEIGRIKIIWDWDPSERPPDK
jgi:hypothetical protein